MIQYGKDGASLTGIGANGQPFSHTVFDGAEYSAMLVTRGAQLQAIIDNANTVADYHNKLATAQQNIGLPGFTAPVKPQQKIVSDTGAVSLVDFVPPLPDLVIQTVNSPSTSVAAGGLMGAVVAEGGPDKQAIMFAMVTALYHKAFPEVTP